MAKLSEGDPAAASVESPADAPDASARVALPASDLTPFDAAFNGMLDLLRAEYDAGYFNIYRLFPVASLVLGDRVQVGNASRFIYHFARSQGYDIPPYPLSSSGEIRQFFADEGVENVPAWYAKIGVTDEEYACLHEYTLVSVRGCHSDRTAFLIDLYLRNWPQFVPLAESGIDAGLRGETLARLLSAVMVAALDETSTAAANPVIRIVRFPVEAGASVR